RARCCSHSSPSCCLESTFAATRSYKTIRIHVHAAANTMDPPYVPYRWPRVLRFDVRRMRTRGGEWTWAWARSLYHDSTGERAKAGLWALGVLEDVLGDDWPERARARDGRPPSITLEAAFHAAVFGQLLEWATT